jgi:5'(3')-deoxyribonucleotidase
VKVFLDLDGVLVDFVGGALRVHNATHIPYHDIRWGLVEQIGISANQFWRGIDAAGEDFWANLVWTHDGREILKMVLDHFGVENVCILTAPSNHHSAAAGKVRWINEHVPELKRQYVLSAAKHFLAGPDKLLIDDHDGNVDKFRAAGGEALLLPRPWNRRRQTCFGNGSLVSLGQELKQYPKSGEKQCPTMT